MLTTARTVRNRGHRYRFTLPPEAAGLPLAAWLAAAWPHTDRAGWAARLAAGEISREGGAPLKPTDGEPGALWPGARLCWDRPPWEEPEVPRYTRVLYEDPELLAVEKPAGLPCMPAGNFLISTLLQQVREGWPEAAPMHRLGRGTSGIVLFARTAGARAAVQRAWRAREVAKVYRTLVCGRTPEEFTVELPIGPVAHAKLGTVFAVVPAGSPGAMESISRARRIGEVAGEGAGEGAEQARTLLDVAIDTGRPHQIRAHLAAAGWPLAGDPLYLPGGAARQEVLPGEIGYRLHARRLALLHPATGAPLVIESVPPPELQL